MIDVVCDKTVLNAQGKPFDAASLPYIVYTRVSGRVYT